jgi:putative acetyltransferase
MDPTIAIEDPRIEDVRDLLDSHLAHSHAVTPLGHVHALGVDALVDPAITFFVARRDGVLMGTGALKRLDENHAEIKSMHTIEEARRQGVGRAMVNHLLKVAACRGFRRVSLETGTMSAFAPARALYAEMGFVVCEPFANYGANPYSTCMTIYLDSSAARNRERCS